MKKEKCGYEPMDRFMRSEPLIITDRQDVRANLDVTVFLRQPLIAGPQLPGHGLMQAYFMCMKGRGCPLMPSN